MDKLEFLGQPDQIPIAQKQSSENLAYMVHEISQPLTSISLYVWGCIYQLTNGAKNPEPILYAMNQAMQNLEYAQEISLHLENLLIKSM